MPFLVLVALAVGALLLVFVLKLAFGLLGWIFGNLLAIAVGAAIGYYYGQKAKAQSE